MPSRVATRASQPLGTASKSRASTVARKAAPANSLEEDAPSSLRTQICSILAEAQRSNNGQRKLVVRLRKVQESCCYEPHQPQKSSSHEEFDENDFNTELTRCVLRVLFVKKSEPAGDRIVRFLGVFLKQATNLDNAIFQEQGSELEQAFPETPSSRLTSAIISLLIPILPSKDKVVRFRATQIISHLINALDSVDEELFYHIRLGLLKRLRDKESAVRVQAVYGLGRLASEGQDEEDGEDSDDENVGGILQKLLDTLQNDPSSEVRRSLLLNLPFTPATLPFLLERARDTDAGIRRALYARLLPALGDFRHLSLTHREKLLRWGLRDRDDNVRKATSRLFRERWIEDCARPRDDNGEPTEMPPGQLATPSSEGLLELLERIDVVNSGTDGGIALDAMKEFWEGRPDYCNFITFDESFWKDLTSEGAFIARTFNDYCQFPSTNRRFDDKMPEVTRFAFLLQENVNSLVEMVRKSALQEEDAEEESVQQEFVVEQLLHIALTLDYSDEIGRRTMFSLMRGALALAELPEEVTKLVVEVLRTTCGKSVTGERELSNVVLEAIAEVHDNIMGDDVETDPDRMDVDDDSFHSAQSEVSGTNTPKNKILDPEAEEERAVREIMVNMKCLHIAQCMLQNVECTLEQNPDVVTMLNNLVVPAVRSMEAPIRERGLLCLGLCCLLDLNLAEENLELFLKCFTKGHEALQVIAIQIIGDVLTAHPTLLVKRLEGDEATAAGAIEQEQSPLGKDIHKLFSKSLKSSSQSVQATACTALAKLMLSSPASWSARSRSLLNHDELLRHLTIAYFNPDTAGSSGLSQSLTYFLPVYCHSRKENMQRMGRISMSILHWCFNIKEELEVVSEGEASGDLVGLGVVVSHLVDWTDGRRVAAAMVGLGEDATCEPDSDVHLDMAANILEKVLGVCSKDERKVYLSVLGKLYISPTSDQEKIQSVSNLVTEAIEENAASDATGRNSLSKMQTALAKIIGIQNTQSPAGSRSRSVAPSAVDDEENDVPELTEDEISSPARRKSVKAPKKTYERLSAVSEVASEVSNSDEAEDNKASGVGKVGNPQPAEEEVASPTFQDELPILDARPKWQVSELQQQVQEEASAPAKSIEETAEAPPSDLPKRRARPSRAAAEPVVANKAEAPQPPRPARRSVRASRRQQSLAASETGLADETSIL